MTFFSDPVFAWSYIAVLAALTAVMAVIDSRTAIIPKKWTLGTLVAGVIAQTSRGALLAFQDKPLMIFETGNPILGALDGFLYAVVAVVVGFAVMFVLWILGACGGGDVKLITGVAAWVGVLLIGQVILVSILVLFVIIAFRILTGQVKMTEMRRMKRPTSPLKGNAAPMKASSRLRATYSLPTFVATLIVMLFSFRGELALDTPAPAAPPVEVPSNVQQ